MAERPDIAIGTKLWKLRVNKVYTVVGETSRSWLMRSAEESEAYWNPATKVAKAALKDGWTLNEQEWVDCQWASKHRWRVAEWVQRHATPLQLREIAAGVGYNETEDSR